MKAITTEPPRTFRAKSLQTGAFQFIPLPFVDDWLIARTRKRLVQRALEERGVRFDSRVPGILTHWANRSLVARARSMAVGVIQKPLRKVFRTVLFWLAIKNAVRTTAETFFLGRYVNHPALNRGWKDESFLTEHEAKDLARVFARVIDKVDHRLVGETAQKIWRLLRDLPARSEEEVSSEDLATAMEQAAPGILNDFDRRVEEQLEAERTEG